MNTYSDKFYEYCEEVCSNNTLKEELSKLKDIANEVLKDWLKGNEDEYKVCVSHTSMQIDNDGDLTFLVVIKGCGEPDFIYKNMMTTFMKKEVQSRWRLEVFVEYERGY